MSDDGLVERVIEQVVDRQRVDWEAVTPVPEAASDSVGEDDSDALAMLRLLDELGALNQAFQRGEFDVVPSRDLPGVAPATAHTLDRPAQPSPAPASSTADDALNTWGRYRLEEQIGRGGFGSVYRGWDPVLQMPVAIKILHRRHSDDRLAERLIREGQLLAQVKHPNVVRVLNVERHDGRVGLVMEYLRGETLDQMVGARGMLNHREATVIAEDVCRALSAVHGVGLVHRDVKARNIMREHDGRIVLMDFGAGMPLDAAPGEWGIVGTPVYMSPEVLRGGPATVASDVYAAGVLLFYLVTRRYPYEGHTVDDIRAAHATGARQLLLSHRADLPHAYVKVVERALATDPQDRFVSPGALLQALLEVGATVRDWTHVAVQAAAAIAGLAVTLTVGGAITSGVFNAALGRQAYATEGVVEWFVLGRRSLVGPLFLALLGVCAVGLTIALRHLILGLVPASRAVDATLEALWDRVAARLRLADPAYSSCWLLLVSAACLVGAWVYWAPLITAVTTGVSVAPAPLLRLFTPEQDEYRGYYRLFLSLVTVVNVTGWYGLSRFCRARGLFLPKWLLPTQAAVLVLLLLSMQMPYRLVNDNDEFPAATWRNERCYVMGQHETQALIFCPASEPRVREVPRSEVAVVPFAPKESIFTAFASSAR